MTTTPHSIGSDQTLVHAAGLMDKYHIRHLPVLHEGKITGMLTDRDLKFALSFKDVDPDKVKVSDIATESVYVVSPFSKLDEVAGTMADKKIGSAVVVDNGKLVGIFTAMDGLTALHNLLNTRDHDKGGGCCNH